MSSEAVAAASIGAEVVDPIDWSIDQPLRPGVDFRDGVTYFTLPAKVKVPREVKRGKKTEVIIERADMLVVVTSDHRQFPYTPENVEQIGYSYPDHVIIPKTRRWSRASLEAFRDQETEAPDPTTLHAGIRSIYEEYIEFADEHYYDILPLFVMGTYMFRLFKSIGYIHFNGTMASGKSQNLRILEALALNTEWASSITASALFRSLAGFPGLILIDEAETWDNERGQDLRQILNAGYLDGGTAKRAEKGKNDTFQIASFETFGPKAIASINPLDYVVGSRCLIVAMRPAIRKVPEFNRDDPRWQHVRDRLYLWAMYHSASVAELIEEWNQTLRYSRAPELTGRMWQITQLYVILADYLDRADGDDRCNRLIAFFNDYFAALQRQQNATDRIRIVLQCLPRVLEQVTPEDGHYYSLKAIHEIVSDRLDPDARDFYKTRNLGKHLDVLGFKNKRSKKGGTQVWLEPDAIRQEFHQRRVDPYEEDRGWLQGLAEYGRAPIETETRASLWDPGEET